MIVALLLLVQFPQERERGEGGWEREREKGEGGWERGGRKRGDGRERRGRERVASLLLVQFPQSETLGRAEEGLHRGAGAALSVYCHHRGSHLVQVQLGDVVEVGSEACSTTQTLLG